MKSGMVVMRATGAEFMEMPTYVAYMAQACEHCGLTNTVYEVYPRSVEGNCLTCSRPQTIPDWVIDFVKRRVR